MPVHLESHDADLELTPGTTKSDIVAFLYRNDAYGYSPRDIHEELAIPHNTAKVTLKRLYDDEYIDKTPDGYYHARPDREDLYRYTAALEGLDRMFTTPEQVDSHGEDTEDLTDTDVGEPATLTDDDVKEAVALVESVPDKDEQ